MLERVGNSLTFLGFYTENGIGKTGLTVTADVRRNSTTLLTDASVTEVGGGLYIYTLSNASVTAAGQYTIVFKTSSTAVDQRHQAALFSVGMTWIEFINQSISGIASLVNGVGTQITTLQTKLLKYVQLITRKDTAIATDNATELGEINASGGSGAGAYGNATDSLEAIRDAGAAGLTVETLLAATGLDTYNVNTLAYYIRLIGSANATVISPVAANGNVLIFQGADYLNAAGGALRWEIASALNLTGGTAWLDVGGTLYEGAVSGSAGAWVVRVDLTRAQTAALALGSYKYEIAVILSGGTEPPPLVTGTLTVVRNL